MAYGVFNADTGFDRRATFLVDAAGIIRDSQVYAPGKIPESTQLLEKLRDL